ncbi:MAG: hypothetical protein D6679_03020 [Candidatus Hydrogenedentota bacterium]|nr:MAG: hypothetical protein D6679_03020 [Candidatus Hydrogenedentota bacterium]
MIFGSSGERIAMPVEERRRREETPGEEEEENAKKAPRRRILFYLGIGLSLTLLIALSAAVGAYWGIQSLPPPPLPQEQEQERENRWEGLVPVEGIDLAAHRPLVGGDYRATAVNLFPSVSAAPHPSRLFRSRKLEPRREETEGTWEPREVVVPVKERKMDVVSGEIKRFGRLGKTVEWKPVPEEKERERAGLSFRETPEFPKIRPGKITPSGHFPLSTERGSPVYNSLLWGKSGSIGFGVSLDDKENLSRKRLRETEALYLQGVRRGGPSAPVD